MEFLLSFYKRLCTVHFEIRSDVSWFSVNDFFVSGDFINKYYFPVFVPIGVTGNILSFLVSTIQESQSWKCPVSHWRICGCTSMYFIVWAFTNHILLCTISIVPIRFSSLAQFWWHVTRWMFIERLVHNKFLLAHTLPNQNTNDNIMTIHRRPTKNSSFMHSKFDTDYLLPNASWSELRHIIQPPVST